MHIYLHCNYCMYISCSIYHIRALYSTGIGSSRINNINNSNHSNILFLQYVFAILRLFVESTGICVCLVMCTNIAT